jgi:hypothetical protein
MIQDVGSLDFASNHVIKQLERPLVFKRYDLEGVELSFSEWQMPL